MRFDDPNLKVFVQIEQPEYKADVELAHKWYQAGYYTADPLPHAEADAAGESGQICRGPRPVARAGNGERDEEQMPTSVLC